jgi:uncharacterized protein (TIGR02246 family)
MPTQKIFALSAVAFVGLLPMCASAQNARPAVPAVVSDAGPEVEAIRKTGQDFEAAYSAQKIEALANLYTPDGEVVDVEGNVVRGRAAIAEEFRKIFASQPNGKMTVSIASIRLVAPDVAVEDGTTRTVPAPNQPPIYGRYVAVHAKRDGQWRVASVRDLEPNSHAIPIPERLKPLEFLIGDWVDEAEEAIVASNYRWGEDRQCILHEFAVKRAGRPLIKGTQRIGWDPLGQTIKSWSFDSAGGHSEGTWTWDRDHWIIKLTGVGAMGGTSSATVFLTPVGKDGYRWQSKNRIMAGESLPDMSVTIVRRPPEPHSAENTVKSPPTSATKAKQGD